MSTAKNKGNGLLAFLSRLRYLSLDRGFHTVQLVAQLLCFLLEAFQFSPELLLFLFEQVLDAGRQGESEFLCE
jgi:hypothetical protein